jgi:hypothetical protein
LRLKHLHECTGDQKSVRVIPALQQDKVVYRNHSPVEGALSVSRFDPADMHSSDPGETVRS